MERPPRGVLRLIAPLQFDPPPPRPAEYPPTYRWIAGPMIKPESERWIKARGDLARQLTRVGFDEEAFALSEEFRADQADVLVNIVHGYSDRGAFDAAFANVQTIVGGALTTDAEPRTTTVLRPDGTISTSTQYNDTRRIEDLERRKHCWRTAFLVLGSAARFGNIEAFKRANAMGLSTNPQRWKPYHNGIVFSEMVPLTEKHGVDTAVQFAEVAFEGEWALVNALDKIARSAAGIMRWDPLWP